MTKDIPTLVRQARIASTPLIAIHTADPAATITSIRASFNGPVPPFYQWDIINGLRGLNTPAATEMTTLGIEPAATVNIADALIACLRLSERSMVFMLNSHRVIADNGVSQAIWNLRDPFKSNTRTLVMLCPMLDLPAEIQQDVLVLDEPLPDSDRLAEIVKGTFKSANLPDPEEEVVTKAVEAVCGLAAFPAEQACAESISFDGLNVSDLWERKRVKVEQTRGLSIWRGGETYGDVRGCQNAIEYLTMVMKGKDSPHGIVWMDEIEKQHAGSGTDTSGVTTEMDGAMLTWMQERPGLQALLLIGPPGCAKSMLAKTTGSTFGKPTIAFDMGAMKNSLVGESGANLRTAFKVVDAVCQGYILVIATCNSFGNLSPEMKRRFKNATFYCDLPNGEEKISLWTLYRSKYEIPQEQRNPNDAGWTGAEIANCCQAAYRYGITLEKSAEYIVPVAKSNPGVIQRLREQAHETFISASYEGTYRIPEATPTSAAVGVAGPRIINLDPKRAN